MDKAHEYFRNANQTTFDGDPIFGGKVEQWHRVSNALELRVLINLSKKINSTDINIKSKFNEILDRNLLLRSNADNLQITFSTKEGQLYPFNESLHSYKQYVMISGLVIDALKANRLFYYANPSEGKLNSGSQENDWDAYIGIDPSDPIDELKLIADKTKEFCQFNNRYTSYEPGEPYIRIGYAEQNFILAEAALRTWITGDAAEYCPNISKTRYPAKWKFRGGSQKDHNSEISGQFHAVTLSSLL